MSCLEMALELVRAGKSIIPIRPRGKKPAISSWDEFKERVATEDEVKAWFAATPDLNIGLICGAVSGLVAVDVDGEEGQAWFKTNMPRPNCYQYTSSKSKFHAFYAHPGHKVAPAVGLAKQVDVRGDGSYVVFAPSIHETGAVYTLHYLQGFHGWNTLVPCPDLGQFKTKPEAPTRDAVLTLDAEDGSRNATLTQHVGRWFAKGMNRDEVLCFALGWNERHCLPPLDTREVERTVDSVHKTHSGNHPLALNADGVRKWAAAIPGTFKVSDLDAELGIKDKDDKLHRTAILEQMCKDGFIERVGSNRGVYRVRDKKAAVLSLDAPDEPEVKMWLPFGLHKNVRIQQKNIIILAGETNAGKTSMMMNMAYMQRHHSTCTYNCSEMTNAELADKSALYGPKEAWDHCTFLERTRNFHDTIVPDGINFIDYLEIYDNFFAIGEDIRKIYDALTTGVAVIAIQKAQGSDLGRGGAFTIEKARLSISMYSHGRRLDGIYGSAKVTKAKNIRPGWNPDGREIFYSLRGGYYFDPSDLPRIPDLYPGWRFYDKKTRDKICQRIETHCREHEVNEEMNKVEFYG